MKIGKSMLFAFKDLDSFVLNDLPGSRDVDREIVYRLLPRVFGATEDAREYWCLGSWLCSRLSVEGFKITGKSARKQLVAKFAKLP